MIVFRLCKSTYALDLSGKGAAISGGRWNSKGTSLIYTSSSRALCTAEVAVHIPLGIVPLDFELVSIEIPDSIILEEIKIVELPSNWKSFPHIHQTQELGDYFVSKCAALVLKVPSAVVQGEFNYLMNPKHEDADKIKIISNEAFTFDDRLFVR